MSKCIEMYDSEHGIMYLRLMEMLVIWFAIPMNSHKISNIRDVEAEMVTYQVKPYVSGIRLVNLPNQNDFITYSEAGESIIYPESTLRVVLFGYHLDRIGTISLTTDNCFNSISQITHSEFIVQTMKRIDFVAHFAESDAPYRICYKERISSKESSEEEEDMIMLDEMRTWISTEKPTRIYYLPIYLQIGIIFVLFCMSALFSGLNLGLMALSPQELLLIQKSGSETERKYAETILPVRRSGNYLLCTILIMNVVVNAAISILFEDMTSGIYAFIIASFGIVVIGEIIPQSICVKKGLAVGAYTIWLTRTFMILTFPLSYPISKVLDVFLGEESPVYDRCKLINLMKMTKSAENEELADDLKIAVGAMEICDKTVGDVLTKIEDVFMIPESMPLDAANIAAIIRRGYSRIPVYKDDDRNHIVSLLMIKDLALIDPRDNFTVRTVCDFYNYPLRFVNNQSSLRSMLEEFKEGNYHLAIVESVYTIYDPKTGERRRELLGIVTLEDIVEEILQAEIVDESDAITDNVYRSRRIYKKDPNITKILAHEEFSKELSLAMERMVIYWLKQSHSIFADEYIDHRALSSLLRRNIKQVDLSYSPRIFGNLVSKGDRVHLYHFNKPSHRFIVIIEGRAIASYGNMEFETGPWNSYGYEILDQLDELISGETSVDKLSMSDSIQFIPDFDLYVNEFCRFLQINSTSYLNAFEVTKIARATRKLLGSNRTLTALKTSKRLDKSGFPRGVSETILKQLVPKTALNGILSSDILTAKRRSNSDSIHVFDARISELQKIEAVTNV